MRPLASNFGAKTWPSSTCSMVSRGANGPVMFFPSAV
jgi:hypothetical protein